MCENKTYTQEQLNVFINAMLMSDDPTTRITLAHEGQVLDKLVKDPNWAVRAAVA